MLLNSALKFQSIDQTFILQFMITFKNANCFLLHLFLGKSAGDYPPDIQYQESPPVQSYRPQILPRPGRHKNDVIWYFDTDEQYHSLRYNFRRDIQYNQRLRLTLRRAQDDNDDIDDDEPERYTYYPKPIRRPIEYDHFEAFI